MGLNLYKKSRKGSVAQKRWMSDDIAFAAFVLAPCAQNQKKEFIWAIFKAQSSIWRHSKILGVW